ncbi:MAG: acetoacetate decarboxylase family protein [Alphaproteobacteria bacterium]
MSKLNRPFTLPDRSPLFKAPPRHYKGYRKLSLYCEASLAGIRKALPQDFETASNIIEVFVMNCPEVHDLSNPEMGPRAYLEGGVVVQARYKNVLGGHVLYEYVTTDDALCGGREVWGYPKKLAKVAFDESAGGRIAATGGRLGKTLIDVSFTPGDVTFEKPTLQPRLQVKRIPRVDGQGFDVDQIIYNELASPKLHERTAGAATVALGGSPIMDPLMELGVTRVVGAEFIVADFHLAYGRVYEDRLAAKVNA